MALSPRLEVRQSQSLTLTPQLMQSIRLLQLSHLELNAFVEAELERNPLLDRDDTSDNDPLTDPDARTERREDEDLYERGQALEGAHEIADSMDTDVANVFPEQVGQDSVMASTHLARDSIGTPDQPDLDVFAGPKASLADHLEAQAGMLLRHAGDRLIARALIDSLDEAGYLTSSCDDIAEQLGTEAEDVEAVLAELQGCDPVGVFARSLSECLSLQLKEKDRLDPLMQALLANLELVAAHNLSALASKIGASHEDLTDMLAELRMLDPRPGRAFDGGDTQTVVPDVFIRRGPDGQWQVELNTEVLPRVLVNRTYYATITKKTRDQGEKSFLVDCMQTASWLAKSLDQRAQTILKVATEIVRQQDGFLDHGVSHLKPMTLKTVAEAIDMHESTVSRVTTAKYLATPRGLFEMKYFFTTALGSTSGGADHSAESVRHRIKELIAAERAEAILSDDTIAEMLAAEKGIEVARRTVAKYREAMNIPSSVIRRRQKRAQLVAS